MLTEAAVVDGAMRGHSYELKYHHYSIVMNERRRLAFFTAVNIDGEQSASPPREPDKWSFDPRISRDAQVGGELYSCSNLDRGHLVRRLDPAWGATAEEIKQANDDTFHFTNCSPQHSRFNQGKNLWAGLEDYVLKKAANEKRRMTVFTGPVFGRADPLFRGIQIPMRYWKVAVIVRPCGNLAALGFVVDQSALLEEVVSFGLEDAVKTFQVPIARIEALTDINFGSLSSFDSGSVSCFYGEQGEERELSSLADIAIGDYGEDPPPLTAELSPGGEEVSLLAEGAEIEYFLVAYDKAGVERSGLPSSKMSQAAERAVADPAVTDVIIFSFAWQADVSTARSQYDRLIRVMFDYFNARGRPWGIRPKFKPVLVGVHWPSDAWADEQYHDIGFGIDATSGYEAGGEDSLVCPSVAWKARLADVPETRDQVCHLVDEILATAPGVRIDSQQLSPELQQAYLQLDRAVGIPADGVGGAPGADRESFDPAAIYRASWTSSHDLAFPKSSVLAPLRALAFWNMKRRASFIGEGAVHRLIAGLQLASGSRHVKFHLVGHGFGCITASGAVVGVGGNGSLPREVDSLVLLQGAVSLWSYSEKIPYAQGASGYYHRLIADRRVRGPIVTTRSLHDAAVATWYPIAACADQQAEVGGSREYPRYGGVGRFGIQGGVRIVDSHMLDEHERYEMSQDSVLNVDATRVISAGYGSCGSHFDIFKPEVAHLIWSAFC